METKRTDAQAARLRVEEAIAVFLAAVGEDPTRDGLQRTPYRVAKAWTEMLSGYESDPADILGVAFESEYDEMVIVRDINFVSVCEHHMMPFWGTMSVGYIPFDGRVIGLSKIPRMIGVLSARLQIQERLTQEVANVLADALSPRGVAVVVNAVHSCMRCRGVKSQASMTTSCMLGVMRDDPKARDEFLRLIA